MTEQLQHAFEIAQKLPDSTQNTLAAYILSEIEQQKWDKLVREPEVQAHSSALAQQILTEENVDETEPPEFDCL